MDYYTVVIIVTIVGFCTLAFILLFPVYRFLKREEEVSAHWTKEEIERQRREGAKANGHDRLG